MPNREEQPSLLQQHGHTTGMIILTLAGVMIVAVGAGIAAGYFAFHGHRAGAMLSMLSLLVVVVAAVALYRALIAPYYRRLEDANLSLHIKQEDILDTKDDLFIKFLGIHDGNYAANSPRPFAERLREVADITARVM